MTHAKSAQAEFAAQQALLSRTLEELDRTRAELLRAQEFQAIGQLATSIARELSTPTQYITDNVAFLQRAFSKLTSVLEAYQAVSHAAATGSDASEPLERLTRALQSSKLDYLNKQLPRALQQSMEGVAELASLAHAMRDLSRTSGAEKRPLDLHDLVESLGNVTRSEWKYVAELVLDFDWNLPNVPGLKSELARALLSLVLNATHAIAVALPHGSSDKGRITVTTRLSGDRAELRISDTGRGIPVAEQALVFDPLAPSEVPRPSGGINLASAYAVIVDKHAGSLRFETEPGKGTTFIVGLPLARVSPP